MRTLEDTGYKAHERLGFRVRGSSHLEMSVALARVPSGMWMLVGSMSLM